MGELFQFSRVLEATNMIFIRKFPVLLAGGFFSFQSLAFAPPWELRENRRTVSPTILCQSAFEYEYLPPNPDANPSEAPQVLASSYPDGTPASLRGEAVRSALLSGRCIGWEMTSDPHLVTGVLKIQGKGMRSFLNNKLTQEFSSAEAGSYQEGCLLDAKGRVIDRLKVSIVDDETALLMTSPGHSSKRLLERLEPFIFPLDEIELTNMDASFQFSLASVQYADIVKAFSEQADGYSGDFSFPSRQDQSSLWNWDDQGTQVLVVPSTGLPSQVCGGFTFAFFGSDGASDVGSRLWDFFVGESNPEGPIAVGALEYETLRIEAGVPAYGFEIGDGSKTSPLELFWQDTINMEKGCYLGQEGVASIHKNPRGPPRTLYSVVFDDDFNVYETQSRGDNSDIENLTTPPIPGDKLFALGSNEELSIGSLTSVAEAGGTGDKETLALALVRRADTVLKQMNELGLEIIRETQDVVDLEESSGLIEPPPLDPLDGMEVIVGGSFTIGKLKMIPSRGIRMGSNKFVDSIVVEQYFEQGERLMDETETKSQDTTEELDLEKLKVEAEKAEQEAQAAAEEAKRKAEKMEMLKKRAEEAMARRKQKKNES